jgi:transposase
MRNGKRDRHTLEFKQEAARLVESGQSVPQRRAVWGVVEQTLSHWVKVHRAGTLKAVAGNASGTAEQMEISRLRAELARVTMERDILGKARHTLQRARGEICLHRRSSAAMADSRAVPGTACERLGVSSARLPQAQDRSSAPLERASAGGPIFELCMKSIAARTAGLVSGASCGRAASASASCVCNG